jgi:predicted ATPase
VLRDADPLLGRTFDGKYRLEGLLGAGATGRVYRAVQLNLQRLVAVKVLNPTGASDTSAVERFKHEALGVARLRHPNIVSVFDYAVSEGFGPYLVFEFLRGRTLADVMKERGVLSEPEATRYVHQICSALDAAHRAGVLHRDLKPQNLFLEETREGTRVKVLDFGLALLRAANGAEGWSDASFVGTPLYVAPEQCEDQPPSTAADVYAVGCVYYEMLTGRPPLTAASVSSLLLKKLTQNPAPPSRYTSGLSTRTEETVLKALARWPEDRFRSAAEFAAALEVPAGSSNAEVRPHPSEAEPNSRTNLPHSSDSFVGRGEYLARLTGELAGARLVSLTGPGGIGKTRLAVESARLRTGAFPDGVWFADLASVRDPGLVPTAILSAVGLKGAPDRQADEVLCEALTSRRLLLVLDNCEHLVDACGEIVGRLLRRCRGVCVLATTREVLGIPGEVVVHLGVLATPSPDDRSRPDELLGFESVRLFVDRARRDDPSFAVDEANVGAISELCFLLEGLPLAIEIAAARTDALSVTGVLGQMNDRFRLLVVDDGAGSRRSALRATIDWSYELLTGDERLLLRRLSVFAGGFGLEAAQICCAGDGIDELAVLDLLTRLTDKSFVDVEEPDDEVRYRMLETIRAYAREKLAEMGEESRQLGKHSAWFLRVAEQALAAMETPEPQTKVVAMLDRERDNLRAALAWSIRTAREADVSVRIAGALWRYWNIRGFYHEGIGWLDEALAMEGVVDPSARASALHGLGILRNTGGEFGPAARAAEESATIRRSVGDLPGLFMSLNLLAMSLYELGDVERALVVQEESISISRELGSPQQLGQAMMTLGLMSMAEGHLSEAANQFEESRTLFRRAGAAMMEAVAQHNLAMATWIAGDAEGSSPHFAESLEIAERVGYQRLVADDCMMLGRASVELGQFENAISHLERAAQLYRDVNPRPGFFWMLESYSIVFASAGRHSLAVYVFEVATSKRDETGMATSSSLRGANLARLEAAYASLSAADVEAIKNEAVDASLEDTITLAIENGRMLAAREAASAEG